MTKERDYQAAANWAEHDMTLKPSSTTALRGEAAAAHGKAALERALGGRPSIDPNAKPGQHSRTRLGVELIKLEGVGPIESEGATFQKSESLGDLDPSQYYHHDRCADRGTAGVVSAVH